MTDVDTAHKAEQLPAVGNGAVPDFNTAGSDAAAVSSEPQPDFVITYEGRDIQVFLNRLTGEDHHHIRAATGQSMVDGLRAGGLDTVAAVVWRILHRTNRKLSYQDVASRVTMDDVS